MGPGEPGQFLSAVHEYSARTPRPGPDACVWALTANWSERKGRPAARGVPVVPQPPVHTPDGAAAARRTCFPRLPCPLGLGRTAQAVLRAEVVLLERPPAPSWTSSVFA